MVHLAPFYINIIIKFTIFKLVYMSELYILCHLKLTNFYQGTYSLRAPKRLNSDYTSYHMATSEKVMATHSSVLAWRIPGTGSLVGCRLWSRTESDTTEAT